MQVVNFEEACADLKSVIQRAADDADVFIVAHQGNMPDGIIMSLDYHNSLMETLYLYSSRANATQLVDSIKQLREEDAQEHQLYQPMRWCRSDDPPRLL